jgi:hypothetical protein
MRDLIEIVPIQDILCSGIGAIERLDGNLFRFWLYVLQTCDDTGAKEMVLTAKIVAPASAVPDAILKMVAALAGEVAQTAIPPPIAGVLH